MAPIAHFLFYGNLNDFLATPWRYVKLDYPLKGIPSVKDSMEALGVPHAEVYKIFINDFAADFSSPVKNQDTIQVFPFPDHEDAPEIVWPSRFILDVHLGKLARMLRLTGFDTIYENNYYDHRIADWAAAEDRMVLTRDIGLLKNKKIRYGYWLRSQHPEEQFKEITQRFGLKELFRPFTRCLKCNGFIELVSKERVVEHLPKDTLNVFAEFCQCENCGQVYWKGSHYEKMIQWIENVKSKM